jgi:hypothetical protein
VSTEGMYCAARACIRSSSRRGESGTGVGRGPAATNKSPIDVVDVALYTPRLPSRFCAQRASSRYRVEEQRGGISVCGVASLDSTFSERSNDKESLDDEARSSLSLEAHTRHQAGQASKTGRQGTHAHLSSARSNGEELALQDIILARN